MRCAHTVAHAAPALGLARAHCSLHGGLVIVVAQVRAHIHTSRPRFTGVCPCAIVGHLGLHEELDTHHKGLGTRFA